MALRIARVLFLQLSLSLAVIAMEKMPGFPLTKTRAFLLVHGFSSSTFEWTEAADHIRNQCNNCIVELVALGKHATIEEFRSSTWRDWGKPIFDTYERLIRTNDKDITLVLSSAAATILLENLANKDTLLQKEGYAPAKIIFVDPFVRPRSSFLWLAPWLQYVPFLNLDKEKQNMTEGERNNSFHIQPMTTLAQLYDLCSAVEMHLRSGIMLPKKTTLEIFYAKNDPVVDPESAMLIKSAMPNQNVVVHGVVSDKHVFSRLRERDPARISDQDRANQKLVFDAIFSPALAL